MIKSYQKAYEKDEDYDMELVCELSDRLYLDSNCTASFMKTCKNPSDISLTKASACELKKKTGLDIGSTDCPRGAWSKDNVRVSNFLNNFEVNPTVKNLIKVKWNKLKGRRGKFIIPYGFVSQPTNDFSNSVKEFWCTFPDWKKAIKEQISKINKVFKQNDIPVILMSYRYAERNLNLIYKSEESCPIEGQSCFSDVIMFQLSTGTLCAAGLGRKRGPNKINLTSKCGHVSRVLFEDEN